MTKKIKAYSEAELIGLFGLSRKVGNDKHPLLQEWVAVQTAQFTPFEQVLFDEILESVTQNIAGWQEEDLKMNRVGGPIYLFRASTGAFAR